MLFDGEMRVSLKEKSVLENFICFGKAFFHVAKLQRHEFMNVPFFAVLVNARFGSCESLLGIGDRRQAVIVDVDQVQRLEGSQLFARDDGGDGISDVPHAVDTKSLLILADGKNSVLDGDLFPSEYEIHSGMSGGARSVDLTDARMRMRRPQQFTMRHAGQENVVSKTRLARYLRAGIDSAPRDADHSQIISVGL